jgi:hypothetical protein
VGWRSSEEGSERRPEDAHASDAHASVASRWLLGAKVARGGGGTKSSSHRARSQGVSKVEKSEKSESLQRARTRVGPKISCSSLRESWILLCVLSAL